MTEPNDAPQVPEREIDFMGRMVWVKMPRPEQLLVWQRTLRQLQGNQMIDWNAEQVMAALERLRKIVDSMILNRIDIDWLDDEMLDGNIGFLELAPLLTDALKAFNADDNRETRRTAKKAAPAKKAARRKATS